MATPQQSVSVFGAFGAAIHVTEGPMCWPMRFTIDDVQAMIPRDIGIEHLTVELRPRIE